MSPTNNPFQPTFGALAASRVRSVAMSITPGAPARNGTSTEFAAVKSSSGGTLSPVLHRAGLALLGLEGDSEAIRTPPDRLGETLRDLAGRGCRGVNVTHPLKEAALAFVTRASARARRARAVNLDPAALLMDMLLKIDETAVALSRSS